MDQNRMNQCGCKQPSRPDRDHGCMMGKPDIFSGLDYLPLAMGYVPWQHYKHTFDLSRGLKEGTIFPELCKPFCGKRGVCKC